MSTSVSAPQGVAIFVRRIWLRIAAMGPGLLVMLAYGDAGNVVVAAQAGARWGYRLLPILLFVTPLIYMLQELAVRLGIFCGKGHGEVLKETFGDAWAWVSAGGLATAAIGTLIAQFTAVAGIGELFDMPRAATVPIAALGLLAVVATDGYRRVERIALAIGVCEGAFFVVAWFSHPNAQTILRDVTDIPFRNREFLYLASAMIGAVLNTWMVFYQQSAVVDRNLGPDDYKIARIDTAIGAVVTQLLTAAVLVAVAATLGARENHLDIHSVGEISEALTPVLGERLGRLVCAVGVLGASSVAAIVSALALVWGLSEVTGHRHSFEHHPLRARWFFGLFSLLVCGCVVLVVRVHDLIWLNIGMQVVSAFLLPLVIALLVLAAVKALPEIHRPRGWYLWMLVAAAILVSGIGLVGGLLGLLS